MQGDVPRAYCARCLRTVKVYKDNLDVWRCLECGTEHIIFNPLTLERLKKEKDKTK